MIIIVSDLNFMIKFSYTISPQLKYEIEKIERLRNDILLQLVEPSTELQMRWDANLDRATHISRTTSKKLKRVEVEKTKKGTDYINANLWIYHNYRLTSQKITPSDIKKVFSFFNEKVDANDEELKMLLEFTQVKSEHPVVQSGIVLFLMLGAVSAGQNTIKYVLPTSLIFLYKQGFEFRGMLDLEEYVANDQDHFIKLLKNAFKDGNLSTFLDYFAEAISISAEKTLRRIKNKEIKSDIPAIYFRLTERQKEIMMLFDKPTAKISNKTIQKRFGISQITASRDLAKLHNLGLIFSAGKGRSVYYTKI